MTDKRLTELQAELEALVNQANAEIPQFIQQWEMRLNIQRGRIMEREFALSENADVLDALEANDPHYSDPPHNPNITRLPITNEREKEA